MPQSECGQRDRRRTQDESRTRLGIGFGAHQHNGDRRHHDRYKDDCRPDQHAKEGVDPLTDGTRGVEPGAGCDDHGDAEQRERDAVATVARLQLTCAADGTSG